MSNLYKQVLSARKMNESFLEPDLDLLYNKKLKNVDKAASLIKQHMDNNNLIVIYGDYDCD